MSEEARSEGRYWMIIAKAMMMVIAESVGGVVENDCHGSSASQHSKMEGRDEGGEKSGAPSTAP